MSFGNSTSKYAILHLQLLFVLTNFPSILSKTVQSYHNFIESARLEFEIFRKIAVFSSNNNNNNNNNLHFFVTLRSVQSQKCSGLIYIAVEALNHE
jgi:hypothetical protein